jgi:hypothetical protein
MNTRAFHLSVLALCWLIAATPPAGAAEAESPRFSALLVWGTNSDKPADKDFKPITPELNKSLRRIFKWKNYFEISRQTFTTTAKEAKQVEMSKECRLVMTHRGGNDFEIQLFGKGVLVVTKRQAIKPGERVILGGDDKNDDAWFVVLSLAKP